LILDKLINKTNKTRSTYAILHFICFLTKNNYEIGIVSMKKEGEKKVKWVNGRHEE
jgi:hypothetical protein